jgi:hypothetical protein
MRTVEAQILWRAHQGAITQILQTLRFRPDNRLDSLNERLEGEGKPQRAKRIPLLHSAAALERVLTQMNQE